MLHITKFKEQTNLITQYGEDTAYLIWAMSLYLDYPDASVLASESLTDGEDDKKIDFLRLDLSAKKLTIAQAAYSSKGVYKAKANKAADLNTAIAWILSGDLSKLRDDSSNKFELSLKEMVSDCRDAIKEEDIEEIEILYVHNLAESSNVNDELNTVKTHLEMILQQTSKNITVIVRELGIEHIERLFKLKEASIAVEEKIVLPAKLKFLEDSTNWKAGVFTIPGIWLKEQYDKYGDILFSANYRGFLGINKRRKINNNIRTTVENIPENFWAYNNGITILTTKFYENPLNPNETILDGISIINGAQTTGSIAHSKDEDKINSVLVLGRVVECNHQPTIQAIIQHNNTQNEIKTWDQYSGNPEQGRITTEFKSLGYEYSIKRGFGSTTTGLSIEQVAQPTVSLHGLYAEAARGKNNIFETENFYKEAFQNIKAKHILLAFALTKAIGVRRDQLKSKFNNNLSTDDESKQLAIMRHLKFNHFFISIVGDCLETIIGQRVDKKQVAFANGIAGIRHNTLDHLIEKCVPIISVMLAFYTRNLNSMNKEFHTIYHGKENYLDLINRMKSSIESVKISTPDENVFTQFSSLIAPLG